MHELVEDVCACRVILNSDPAALVLRLSVSLPWSSTTVRVFAQYFLFHQVGPKIKRSQRGPRMPTWRQALL